MKIWDSVYIWCSTEISTVVEILPDWKISKNQNRQLYFISKTSPHRSTSGGGVLSPLIFVLYVSDLQDWLKHLTAPTYADDTLTRTSTKSVADTVSMMEEDAAQVLKYMASNGLVANAKKTSFLLLNAKQADANLEIQVGKESVKRESSAVLLGIRFQDDLKWKPQIYGKGGVISALNSRLYIIRRLQNHRSTRSIRKMVDGIFISKVRYGLQLLGRVRVANEDPECGDLKAIQLILNKLLRLLNGTKVKDLVSTKSMLDKFGILSINQLNAQVKLLEIWKGRKPGGLPSSNQTTISTSYWHVYQS